jgi:hypothetical protein
VKIETPKRPQTQKIVKNETTPSPFRLSNHSVRPKVEPKLNTSNSINSETNHSIKHESKPEAKPKTTTPRIPNLASPLPTYKKETTNETPIKPSTTKTKPIAKRTFVDLTDEISSNEDDDDDETPSKKL